MGRNFKAAPFYAEEEGVLEMNQYELIRTGHRVYGENISELSRLTGHSRNTIKKAIRGEPWGYKERQHQPFPALGNYMETIDSWLKSDRDKPKKQRHTAHRIYNRLQIRQILPAQNPSALWPAQSQAFNINAKEGKFFLRTERLCLGSSL